MTFGWGRQNLFAKYFDNCVKSIEISLNLTMDIVLTFYGATFLFSELRELDMKIVIPGSQKINHLDVHSRRKLLDDLHAFWFALPRFIIRDGRYREAACIGQCRLGHSTF